MFIKNKMLLNIVIDFVMLIAMALVSISGFILEIVIPSRHAVKFQGVTPWSSQLLGLGRHDWGEIHLWAGIVLVILLTNIALYFIFNAIDNDNNALACLFIKTAIISPAVF